MSKIGEVTTPDGDIELNAGRHKMTVHVTNTGDRAVQVGSHYHFFETNKALDFDRNKTLGYRLDIPAGTAIRFEPGTDADVTLVKLGGIRRLSGFAGLVNGSLDSSRIRRSAFEAAKAHGYAGAEG